MSQFQHGLRKSRKLVNVIVAASAAALVGVTVSACGDIVPGPPGGVEIKLAGPSDAQGYMELLEKRVMNTHSPEEARHVFWDTSCDAARDLDGLFVVPSDLNTIDEGDMGIQFAAFWYHAQLFVSRQIESGILPTAVVTEDLQRFMRSEGTVCDIADNLS